MSSCSDTDFGPTSFRLSLFRSQRKVWFNLTLLNTQISCLFFIQDHCCILYSIIGWNCSIGMWSRVEGSRCDPNPNEEFSRPDGESLFGEDGKLTPSITILGRRKKDFGSQFRNIHGDMESSSIAFSRASRTLPGFLLFFTLSPLWLLVREKFLIDCGEQSGVGFGLLCVTLWIVQKTRALSRPIRFKSEINRGWSLAFSRALGTYLIFVWDFIGSFDISLCSDWLLWWLWFWRYATQLKCVLLWNV